MSKTVELARHLETLHINNMYKSDFYWTWDKTDDEIDAIFTVADALRDLRERNKSTRIFDSGLGISLFRDNSTRTRFSFASACNLLGLEEQVLDEKKSQIAHGETVRETANMVSFMADVIGIRDDMYIGQGHTYQKTFMDALEDGYRQGILEQRPTLVNLQCDVDHPTQILADMLTMEEHISKPLNKCKVAVVGDGRRSGVVGQTVIGQIGIGVCVLGGLPFQHGVGIEILRVVIVVGMHQGETLMIVFNTLQSILRKVSRGVDNVQCPQC